MWPVTRPARTPHESSERKDVAVVSRGVWFVAGAGAGIYATVRARRAAEALSADGIRDRLNGLAVGARMFRDEVVQGRAEKETELRERLGLVPDGTLELTAGRPHAVPDGSSETERGST